MLQKRRQDDIVMVFAARIVAGACDGRTEAAMLPTGEKCLHPTYIVTGSRFPEGFIDGGQLETLRFLWEPTES